MECCWRTDSKERPSFREILKTLDDIAHSKFHQMPDDNFYTLQADWKVEIDEKIIEIREKEKVTADLSLLAPNFYTPKSFSKVGCRAQMIGCRVQSSLWNQPLV